MSAPVNYWPDKDPGDRLDFTADFSQIFDAGELVASATWAVTGNPTLPTMDATSFSGAKATVVVSGGVAGQTYTFTVTATSNVTVGGFARIYQRDIKLRVRNL